MSTFICSLFFEMFSLVVDFFPWWKPKIYENWTVKRDFSHRVFPWISPLFRLPVCPSFSSGSLLPRSSTIEWNHIWWNILTYFMCGASHIWNVLIGVECWNCRQTLDVYLLFAICMGQIQSKLIDTFATYGLASL